MEASEPLRDERALSGGFGELHSAGPEGGRLVASPRTPFRLIVAFVAGGGAGTSCALLVWWLLDGSSGMTWPVTGLPWLVAGIVVIPAAYRSGLRDASRLGCRPRESDSA